MSITVTGVARSLTAQPNLKCDGAGMMHDAPLVWTTKVGRVPLALCPVHLGLYVEPTAQGIAEFIPQLLADRTGKAAATTLVDVVADLLHAGGFTDLANDLSLAYTAIASVNPSGRELAQARMLISSVAFELLAPTDTTAPAAADQDDDACETGR